MEPTHHPLARVIVFALAGAVVVLLAFLGARSKPDQRGWRSVKAGAMHWFGVILGGGLTGLFTYVWLFVGSSRADAAEQMAILFWLIVAFGLGTIIVALNIHFSLARAIRWRGKSIAFAGKDRVEKRTFADITDMQSRLWGGIVVRFRDGAVLRLDPYATGARQLIDAISDFLAGQPNNEH